MRNSRADVVSAALRVLDAQGLENCSMRRVAAEIGVQPSALYHHVPDKQTLLALMADEIVRGVGAGVGVGAGTTGDDAAAGEADPARSGDPAELCRALRRAMLSVRDGADVVATAAAFRLGSSRIEAVLAKLVGVDGGRTLLLYTFGHAQSTQTHRQAADFGALLDTDAVAAAADLEASFDRGLGIILRGLGR